VGNTHIPPHCAWYGEGGHISTLMTSTRNTRTHTATPQRDTKHPAAAAAPHLVALRLGACVAPPPARQQPAPLEVDHRGGEGEEGSEGALCAHAQYRRAQRLDSAAEVLVHGASGRGSYVGEDHGEASERRGDQGLPRRGRGARHQHAREGHHCVGGWVGGWVGGCVGGWVWVCVTWGSGTHATHSLSSTHTHSDRHTHAHKHTHTHEDGPPARRRGRR
jgi:hypothetical protein